MVSLLHDGDDDVRFVSKKQLNEVRGENSKMRSASNKIIIPSLYARENIRKKRRITLEIPEEIGKRFEIYNATTVSICGDSPADVLHYCNVGFYAAHYVVVRTAAVARMRISICEYSRAVY